MVTGRFARRIDTNGLAFLMAVAAALAMIASPAASAIEVETLYTVKVPLDADDPEAQENAYARALGEVLIRVTGSEAAATSEDLLALFPTPARYVLQYRRGENDSLVVSLDGPAIESLLRRAGQPVWGRDRPLTLVWLAVDWGGGEREIVAADDTDGPADATRSIDRNRLLRERVLAAAERRGIPVVFPLLDTEDLRRVSFSDIWGGFDDALIEASRRYGTSSVLVGRVRGNDLYRNRWSYYFGAQRRQWTGGPAAAIDLLADALAEQFAYSGNAPVETVILTISGVDSVSAYGTVQRFLAGVGAIDAYRVDAVQGPEIRFHVRVQGGAERLASALQFSGILERREWFGPMDFPTVAEPADSLDYVYRPFSTDTERPDEAATDTTLTAPSAAEIN